MIVLLFFLTLLALPLITDDPYLLRILILTSIFAIFAASWDLLSGFTGQMNFGHALFFGVGAYGAALLNLHLHITAVGQHSPRGPGRRPGGFDYRHSLSQIAGHLSGTDHPGIPHYFNGYRLCHSGGYRRGTGYIRYRPPRPVPGCPVLYCRDRDGCSGDGYVENNRFQYRELFFMPSGRMRLRCALPGINTTRYKLMAFCLSGFFAGMAGGLYAHFMRIAGPSTLEVSMSFQVVIWAVFGGVVTIWGPVGAVFILFPLLEFFRFWPEFRMLLFAIVILLILLFMPQGLLPWIRDKIENECPRCKIRNVATRKNCRICDTSMH